MNKHIYYEVTVTLKPKSLTQAFPNPPTEEEKQKVAWKIFEDMLFNLRHEDDLTALVDIGVNMVISRDGPVGVSCYHVPIHGHVCEDYPCCGHDSLNDCMRYNSK